MDQFPACFDQNIGMNLGKDAYLFQRSKREPSIALVGLIPDTRLYRQDFLPYYIIYPISDFLLYPSHTYLLLSYSVISCEGCEVYRSFLLKEKNQKFKAASAELLRHFVTLCAPQTRFAQTATLRPLHFVPTLNAHQNEASKIEN